MENSNFASLPSELISKIFQECLPAKASFKPLVAPLMLTHVCRTWSYIALETPQLWSRIEISKRQDFGIGVDSAKLLLVKQWLSRAGKTPLSISIDLLNQESQESLGANEIPELHAIIEKLLLLLAPYHNCIQFFRGVIPRHFMHSVGVPDMLNAEQILYYGLPNETPIDNEQHMYSLNIGPAREKLKSISICYSCIDFSSIKIQTQLTHLELFDLQRNSRLCQETALDLMHSLPNLEICILDLAKEDTAIWIPPSEHLIMNHLKLLSIIWTYPGETTSFLDSLVVPCLVELNLRGTLSRMHRPWSSLYNLLLISKPQLRELSIGNTGAVDINLLESLRLCPLLTSLCLDHCTIPANVISALTCTHEEWDRELLPNLSIFKTVVCTGMDPDSLYKLLRSRAKDSPHGVSLLLEAEILNCPNIWEKSLSLLESCGVEKLTLKAKKGESDPYLHDQVA